MDVAEVRLKKQKLETEINSLIAEFMQETQVQVHGINYDRLISFDGIVQSFRVALDAKI